MCGLACAVGLSRSGIRVDVFEAGVRRRNSKVLTARLMLIYPQAKFEEVGAGVNLGGDPVLYCLLY